MSNVLNFDVYKNTLQRTDGLPPVSSERNYSDIVCHFKDEDWGGIGVLSAGFYVTEKQVYSVVSSMLPSVDDESTDCYTAAFKIPTVLVGNRNPIYFGICKSFSENNEVVKTIATNVVAIDVARGVVIPSDLTPAEEASLYEQLLAAVGEVLDAKADKTYVDDELDLKADAATTYTKSETDGLLDQKADNATTLAGYGITDAYTKTETTNLLADKADKATTLAGYGITDAYTKTDVESALAGKADVNHTHSQYLTEHQDISGKADIADIPTKTSQLQNDSGFLTAHQDISGKVNFVEVVRNDVTKNEVDSCLSENTIYHVYLRTAVVSYDWAMVWVLKTSQFIIQYALTTSEYVIFRRVAISNGVIGTWNSWDFIPNHTKTNELINDAIAGKANIADVPTKTSDLTNDSGFLTSHQDISGKADKSNTVFYQELIGYNSGQIDQLANDSKTIYRVVIGDNSGLLFNINTNRKNFQYILMNNGDVLQRSKLPNAEWNNKEFTTIIPDISGKADIADIPTKTSDLQNDSGFLTEHQSLSDYYTKAKTQNIIDLSVYSKLRLDNGKLIYTDDDIPYDLGDAKNVFYTKTEIDTALSGKESAGNKVTSISSSSTDAQYPSAKAVYNKIGDEIGRTIDYTFSTSGSGLISGLTVEAGKNGDYYLTFYDSSYHPHHLFNLSSILPDISGKADTSAIPTKTSDLQNDSGFLTAHQDISGKADASSVYTKTQTDEKIYDVIDETLSASGNTSPKLTVALNNGAYWLTYVDSEENVHYLYNISAIMPDISGKADASSVYTKTQTDDKIYEGIDDTLSETDSSTVPRLTIAQHNGAYWLTYFDSEHSVHYLYNISAIMPDISGKADAATTLAGYGITDGLKVQSVSNIDACTERNVLYRVTTRDDEYYIINVIVEYGVWSQFRFKDSQISTRRRTWNASVTPGEWNAFDSFYDLEDSYNKVTSIPTSPVSGTYPTTGAVKSFVEGKGYLTQHQDISGKANIADIPTKTSDLQNDSGFLTQHQSLSNYYNKTDVNNLLDGKANASHTHAQYLTQHQDISGKADKSDTYTKAEVDAAIQSAPGIIVFAQENAAVTAYLQNANYSASDYSGSVVETYNTNTYGTNRDRPVGKLMTIPSGAASIRLLDTLSGDAYTAAVSGQSYSLKSLIPDRMYLYTFLSAGGAVVGSGSVIFNGKVRMIDAGGSTFNIRDIGGWRCDGGTLAYGKIIRGCELNDNNYNVSLTSEQQRFFREFLNIRDEIDLRNASQTDGADDQQGTSDDIVDTALGDGVTYVRYPVVEYATGLDLSNAVYTANYANCIKRIADDLKKGLPIYLHCMAGADRTGTVCALIEAICGVSQTDIDKEFELTTFSGNTRRRNGTSWSGMVTLINSFTGDTFRDKVLYYMLHAGVTIDEINAIRKGLINGYAHELSEPEQPAGRIPAEYQEVEYIASSGTQTIQIPFDSTYVGGYIEMDIKRTNSGVRGLIGSASTNTVDIGAAGGTYFGWTTTGFYEMGPSQTSSITSSTSSFDHVKFEWTASGSGKLTVNGTVATSRSGSTAYSRWNVFGGTAYPVSCQMKDVVVYNIAGGGTKTAHLVPCYRKADNVIGMYDIVTDTFYTNIGSGTFTKGADVTE